MPDDGLAGRTIQPALKGIEFAPPAHSRVKETSQLCNGWARRSDIAEMCALFGPDPVNRVNRVNVKVTTNNHKLVLPLLWGGIFTKLYKSLRDNRAECKFNHITPGRVSSGIHP